MAGGVEDRAVERAVRVAKERARDEVHLLVAAGRKLLHRDGAADMTIADVLSEAGLSTRAFYRHFASKSDLLLAIYDHEVERYRPLLQRRLDAATTARAASKPGSTSCSRPGSNRARRAHPRDVHLGDPVATGVPGWSSRRCAPRSPTRSRRCSKPGRADGSFPNAEPARDAQFIRALTWEIVEEHLSGAEIDIVAAREDVLRFCLPALGATR